MAVAAGEGARVGLGLGIGAVAVAVVVVVIAVEEEEQQQRNTRVAECLYLQCSRRRRHCRWPLQSTTSVATTSCALKASGD